MPPCFLPAFLGICLVLVGCDRQPPLPYTSPAGSIDMRPDPLWGEPYPDIPPDPSGRPFDPTQGLGVQRYADELAGRRVADFVAIGWDALRSGGEINTFFTVAKAGPGRGLCETRPFLITGGFSGSRVVRTSEGQWLPPVYAVAGSLAPNPRAESQDYRRQLEQACKQRDDMEMWFGSEPTLFATEPERAYTGARLVDAVVAAARQPGKLPFQLRCTPFPSDVHYQNACAADVRMSTAAINPRAILQVRDCRGDQRPDCVSVELAKVPRRSTRIEDLWTFDISFDRDNFQIEEVNLADTQLIID